MSTLCLLLNVHGFIQSRVPYTPQWRASISVVLNAIEITNNDTHLILHDSCGLYPFFLDVY